MKSFPKIIFTASLIILPLLAACSSGSVSAAAVNSIGQKLNCVCGGCNLNVINCNDDAGEQCATAKKQVVLIRKGLAAGQSEEQIIRNMVGMYGQRVLVE